MHAWAGSHVSVFRWVTQGIFGERIRNGTAFFVDIGGTLLAITAAHVYRGYLKSKQREKRIICHLGNVEFSPEKRLRGLGKRIDIATFDITYDELKMIRKQPLIVPVACWPPLHPFSGQSVYFAGFPGESRLWTGWDSISFGLYIACARIGTASDRQITCPFEREFWIDPTGHGLPPMGFDLGGISGGPLLLPMEEQGIWTFHLGGVISEAHASKEYETLVATPAHFIADDGSIRDEFSAPCRHAVPAT